MPLILGLDRARLSKRHGATSVLAYRDEGFLPEAMINYLARLGWSAGDQEIFTGEELIAKFSLEHVGESAGVFNPEKLEWVNAQHLKMTPPSARRRRCSSRSSPSAAGRRPATTHGWRAWRRPCIERAKTLVDLLDQGAYYFTERGHHRPDAAAAKHLAKAQSRRRCASCATPCAALDEWTVDRHRGRVPGGARPPRPGDSASSRQPVRVALTGGTVSPGIYEVIEVRRPRPHVARLERALPMVGAS